MRALAVRRIFSRFKFPFNCYITTLVSEHTCSTTCNVFLFCVFSMCLVVRGRVFVFGGHFVLGRLRAE